MKNRKGIVMMLMGLLLMLAALFYLFMNLETEREAGSSSGAALTAIDQLMAAPVQGAGSPSAATQRPDAMRSGTTSMPQQEMDPAATAEVPDGALELTGTMPSLPADSGQEAVTAAVPGTLAVQGTDGEAPATGLVPQEAGTLPQQTQAVVVLTVGPAPTTGNGQPETGSATENPQAVTTDQPQASAPAGDPAGTGTTAPTATPGNTVVPIVVPTATPAPYGQVIQLPEVPDYVLHPEMEMPEVEIDGQIYIGVLELPTLGLRLPIISRWSYPNLKVAPCRYSGSVYKDDLILLGHNYSTHFGTLSTLAMGDPIIFTDMAGNVFSFEVAEMETLGANQMGRIAGSDYPLTIFTCTPGGQRRVTIRGQKVQKETLPYLIP